MARSPPRPANSALSATPITPTNRMNPATTARILCNIVTPFVRCRRRDAASTLGPVTPKAQPAPAVTATWTAAYVATWLVFAWLPLGFVTIAALTAALTLDVLRRIRLAPSRTGVPPMLNGSTAAAYITGVLFLAVMVGYQADWIVLAGLVGSWGFKMVHIANQRLEGE